MRRLNQTRHLALLLTISLLTYSGYGFACGSGGAIKSFRLALASSGPLVNALAASGAIPQNRVTAIIADFDAGAQCGFALQQDFAAIDKELTSEQQRPLKLSAATRAFKCFRTVLERQSFAAHPRLQQVANIADGILASLVIFYSDGTGDAVSPARSAATISAQTEKDLERQMESQMKALSEAMRP